MSDEGESRPHRPALPGHAPPPRRPLPRWMFRVINPVVRILLRSPLHALVSRHLILLTFRGHLSGRQYAVPVAALHREHRLYFTCLAAWWRNLPGTPVTVQVRGRPCRGTAIRVVDPDEMKAIVRLLIARRGPLIARRIGLLAALAVVEAGTLPERPVLMRVDLEDWPP
jgi:hypothetical protein